jgi:enoyl-CoA hydratase
VVGFETILYGVERGRARITLNRPDKLNALSTQLQAELSEALWEADNDRAVHCVILKGAGRAFCSGYDMKMGPAERAVPVSRIQGETGAEYRGGRGLDDDAWHLERAQRFRMALFDMHKPVIAQVHGYCLAGATDIALLADMVICADDAVFGFPAARDLGALPNNMWLYHVGPQWAKRLTLSGDTITGKEAQAIGLVLKAVAPGLLEAEVEQLADRLALIDADLLSANKRTINLGLELMGARTLQRLSAEMDARAHNSRAALATAEAIRTGSLQGALRGRDSPFGDGRARVDGPETRDAAGRLTEG